MPITKQHRQEALSVAYVQAVAGACGMTCSYRLLDYGVDMTLHYIGNPRGLLMESSFRLDLQIKSTIDPIMDQHQLRYDLDVRNYICLREPDTFCPRILLLLVLPANEAEWLHITERRFVMKRCMYWTCLTGAKPTTNKRSIRVTIPRKNVFSTKGLERLISEYFKQGAIR